MNRKAIDWDRHVPLGMDGKKTVNRMAALLGIGIGCSLLFLLRYFTARSALYGYQNGRYQRMEGVYMEPFGVLMDGVFLGMAVVAVGFAVLAVIMYLYHYQGCRSIYTMKRLPNPWELWRRCLTVPALFLLLCGLCTAVLTAVYFLIWRYATPADCFL